MFSDIEEFNDIVNDIVEPELPLAEKEGLNYFGGYMAAKSNSIDLGIKDNNWIEDDAFITSQWLDLRLYVN